MSEYASYWESSDWLSVAAPLALLLTITSGSSLERYVSTEISPPPAVASSSRPPMMLRSSKK